MVLVSPPVADALLGALDQLSNSTSARNSNIPRLVHLGDWTFAGCGAFKTAPEASRADGDIEMAVRGDEATAPLALWHIFNEPLLGRHIKWDDVNLKVKASFCFYYVFVLVLVGKEK